MTIEYKDSKRIVALSSDVSNTPSTEEVNFGSGYTYNSSYFSATGSNGYTFTENASNIDQVMWKDLTTSVVGTKYVMRFPFTLTSFTGHTTSANNHKQEIGLGASYGTGEDPTHDFVGLRYNPNQNTSKIDFHILARDGSTKNYSAAYSVAYSSVSTPTTWYIEIIRNENVYTLNVYSDSAYSTSLGTATVTQTGITGLRYFNHHLFTQSSNGVSNGSSAGYDIYNGVSSLTNKPTNVQDNSLFVEKDTARRYWFSTEDSGETDIQDKTLVQNGDDITYSGGVIDVNIGSSSSSEGDYLLHTLDVPITTTDFVLDFDYKRVSGGTGVFGGLVFRSNQSGESIENSNTGDYIRTSPNAAGTSMDMYWHNDGDSTETQLGYLTGLNSAGNWNYLRLTRTNGTTIKLERFSSEARSGSADATVTATNLSATWGLSLKYIGGYCAFASGGGLEEHFDNIDLSSTTKSATWTMQPTFEDDFSSDNWVDQDTEQQVTGGSLVYDPKRDNTNDASSYDLQNVLGSGVNADNEKWVLQYVQNHTSVYTSGNGNRLWFGISDKPSSTAQNGTHQFIGLYQNFDFTSKYGAIGVDGGALPQNNTATVVPATGTDYYTRITRVSSTSMRVQIWTGGYDQTVFYDETLTIASTLVDLRYIWIGNFISSAGGDSITGTIDDLSFYNGVTSIN